MSRTQLTKDAWLAALRSDATALRAAAGNEGVLGNQVPSCPGWTMGELIRHVGSIYQWVSATAGRGTTDKPHPREIGPEVPEADDPTVLGWFDEQLGLILAFLDNLDPDLPAWNWAPQARKAGFWHRRMAHETAIHRWDAQLSVGLTEPIETKLAGDTIAEVLDTWLPAGRRRETPDVHGLVHLVAADLGQEWYVRLRGAGIALLDTNTLLDDDSHPARAAASGNASDVALALWGRLNWDVLDTAGDDTLLTTLHVA
ncbi:maleylpyruvate isomerase family mycothiol-dependent enzyme [Luedemannella flava]